jgi:tetratricopeptide (TPR) repeat protein
MSKSFWFFFGFIVFLINLVLPDFGLANVLAQDKDNLKNCVCQGKIEGSDYSCLDKEIKVYSDKYKYQEFVELLRGLCPDNKIVAPALSYYIAMTRYQQLKYLEESNSWDEYFAKGNDYRDDITKEAAKAIAGIAKDDPLYINSRLLIFRFHKDQQDNFTEGALTDLMDSTTEYAKANKDMKPVKEVADILLSYDEKSNARKLYKLYAQVLTNSDIKNTELKDAAVDFYKNGNLELSESLYDSYIDRIIKDTPKDKLVKELKEIAVSFSYKDLRVYDIAYAEKIFKKIEEVKGLEAFDEELIYLRGFNLEKNKEFASAKDIYLTLLKRYPDTKHSDEVNYKIGIITVYLLNDIKSGRDYFGKLADGDGANPYTLTSLYQMGLLKQWEGDFDAAHGYYNKLIEKSEGKITDTVLEAQERLDEIKNKQPLMYNLKTLMDVLLKDGNSKVSFGKVDLKSNLYLPQKGQELDVNASAYLLSSGCFNVEMQYLWSLDLGGAKPDVKQPLLKTSYKNNGTKAVGVVLVSPSGIEGASLDLIDVR